MRVFGLIGYPLGHSFSKKYFSQKFQEEDITDTRYELFPLERIDELPGLLVTHPNLHGLNVTIPYKEQVLPYLDVAGKTTLIGACNCIHVHKGLLYGYNTDVVGFWESFRVGLKPGQTKALILGTGGAARAVAFALAEKGFGFRYVSRRGGGDALGYEDITPGLLQTYTIIINCSPVGTFPHVEAAPALPYDALSARHYLFDLVYNPERTRFLAEGEARGAVIRNGYDMLRIQAEESWNIWNAG